MLNQFLKNSHEMMGFLLHLKKNPFRISPQLRITSQPPVNEAYTPAPPTRLGALLDLAALFLDLAALFLDLAALFHNHKLNHIHLLGEPETTID